MLAFLLAGDGTVVDQNTSRAQLPLLLAQTINLTTIAVDQATEEDLGFDVTVFQGAALIPVEQATETDSAFDISVSTPATLFVTVDQASETDSAFDIDVSIPVDVVVILGLATETDEAFTITYRRSAMTPVFVNTDSLMSPAVVTGIDLEPVEVA